MTHEHRAADRRRRHLDGRAADRLSRTVPADQVLPDRQPAYVASWIYVFGVLTLAGLVVVVGSGIVPRRWAARPGGTPRRSATS